MLGDFQEGEEGKEEEEKESFGKLEYSLDYNFTDNQVHTHLYICNALQYSTFQTQKWWVSSIYKGSAKMVPLTQKS